MLGKHLVPGHPANFDYSSARLAVGLSKLDGFVKSRETETNGKGLAIC